MRLKARGIRSPFWCMILAMLMPVWGLLPNRLWFGISNRALYWEVRW